MYAFQSPESAYTSLQGEVPLPYLCDIAADETNLASRTNTLYVKRNAWLDDVPSLPSGNYEDIRTVTEAEAIKDTYDSLTEIGAILVSSADPLHRDYGGVALDLRDTLRFLGVPELSIASRAIAKVWANRLNSGEHELLVGVSRWESPVYILHNVLGELAIQSPEAAARVIPFSIATRDREILSKAAKGSVDLVDDWAVTGNQLGYVIEPLRHEQGLSQANISVTLLSAPQTMLKTGVAGAQVSSYYSHHDYPEDEINRCKRPSLTGSHCVVDYGFENMVKRIWHYGRKEVSGRTAAPSLPYPLLSTVINPYRQDVDPQTMADLPPAEAARVAAYQSVCTPTVRKIIT